MNRLIIVLFFSLTCISNALDAKPNPSRFQQVDSMNRTLNDSINSMMDFQSNYLIDSEVEHEKLLRNIFIVGFFLILGFLIFTILFYGGKIKKVSNIIVLQNEAVNSSKDQLIKIINIFNYIDQQVYITDSKGNVEWLNSFASKWYTEEIENNKSSLLNKFKTENQGVVFQGINEDKAIIFKDNLFGKDLEWKMIPIKNSKGEFSNMVFVGA